MLRGENLEIIFCYESFLYFVVVQDMPETSTISVTSKTTKMTPQESSAPVVRTTTPALSFCPSVTCNSVNGIFNFPATQPGATSYSDEKCICGTKSMFSYKKKKKFQYESIKKHRPILSNLYKSFCL